MITSDTSQAASCYEGLVSICLKSWYEHYEACLPQELDLWRLVLSEEFKWLESIGPSPATREIADAIEADVDEFCDFRTAKLITRCSIDIHWNVAVTLRINRLWLGGRIPD